jgi:MFS family permease
VFCLMRKPRRINDPILQLLLLAGALWGGTYARFVIGPLQELVQRALTLSDNQVALLQGAAMAVPMSLGSMPLGFLADRLPRARMLTLYTAVALASCLSSSIASNFQSLFAARFVAGLSSSAILVTAYSMIGDLYEPAQRGRATMVLAGGEIVGAPACFALGGYLINLAHSTGRTCEAWRWALLWMTVGLLPVVVSTLFMREPDRGGLALSAQKPGVSAALDKLWRLRGVAAPILLARGMVWIADGAVVVWGTPLFIRRFGVSAATTGALMGTVMLISGLAGPVLGGPLADFFHRSGGPQRTMTAMAILAMLSAAFTVFPFAPSAKTAGVMLAVFLTLGFSISTASSAIAIIVIPVELRGFYMGITVTVGSLLFVGIAPLIVSVISGALGGEAMIGDALFGVCFTMSVVGAAVFALSAHHFSAAPQ